MKKLFENWRKSFNEAAFEPGRATGDIEASMGSPDVCLKKMQCASWLISLVLK